MGDASTSSMAPNKLAFIHIRCHQFSNKSRHQCAAFCIFFQFTHLVQYEFRVQYSNPPIYPLLVLRGGTVIHGAL